MDMHHEFGKPNKKGGPVKKKTGVKSNQQLIEEKNALLQAVIENADGYIWCIDTSRCYITFNSLLSKTVKQVFNVDIKPGDKVCGVLESFDPSKTDEWEALYQLGFEGR